MKAAFLGLFLSATPLLAHGADCSFFESRRIDEFLNYSPKKILRIARECTDVICTSSSGVGSSDGSGNITSGASRGCRMERGLEIGHNYGTFANLCVLRGANASLLRFIGIGAKYYSFLADVDLYENRNGFMNHFEYAGSSTNRSDELLVTKLKDYIRSGKCK